MAKFPTEVERSVTVKAPLARVYDFFWDVVGSSKCIEGLKSCKRTKANTYCFVYADRSSGPVTMSVRYTARYEGNGVDRITFASTGAPEDNTEVSGTIRLEAKGPDSTRIVVRQAVAPDTPIPRLLQGLMRSFVENEAAEGVRGHLARIKQTLEEKS